jgi:hypothetical protein
MSVTTCKIGGGALFDVLACGAVLAQGPEMVPGGNPSDVPSGPVASTIIFGSNLISDPCATCNYSDREGYAVLGPDNCFIPGTTQGLAGAFIAAATGVPEQISAAIILRDPSDCPTNTVTLSVYTDACWPIGPGTPLVSAVATVPVAPCGLAVAKLANTPTLLIKGTKYWVVATTNAQQAGLDSNWYGSNNAQYALNTGDGWQHVNGITPALMVEGSGIGLSQIPIDPSHQTFGGNLFVDPCTGCSYYAPPDGASTGFDVCGPENCNSKSLSWSAVPFVAAKSGVPTRISASIILYNPAECPYNKVTLSLYTDNCDVGPDTLLASGIANVPAASCGLAVARLRNAPALVHGVKYWVTATTTDQQAGLDATWYASNAAQLASNAGFGWLQFSAGTPGFLVQ